MKHHRKNPHFDLSLSKRSKARQKVFGPFDSTVKCNVEVLFDILSTTQLFLIAIAHSYDTDTSILSFSLKR
jgi:hypothetical protein